MDDVLTKKRKEFGLHNFCAVHENDLLEYTLVICTTRNEIYEYIYIQLSKEKIISKQKLRKSQGPKRNAGNTRKDETEYDFS